MKDFLASFAQSFSFTQGTKELLRCISPFLKENDIKNFYYVQITKTGKLIYLTNDVEYAMDYWEAGLPLRTGFEERLKEVQNYTVEWNTVLEKRIVDFAAAKGGFNGFSFVERYPDYVQFASFLFTSQHKKVDKLFLHSFLRQFQWKNQNLIRRAKENPLTLPETYVQPQKEAFYPKRSVRMRYNGIQAKLGFRELDCLSLYGCGFTIARIGQLLGISSRTVETHLESVKDRFGLSARNDLAELCYVTPQLQNYMPRFHSTSKALPD